MKENPARTAPGRPGSPPKWSSSAKMGVGTSCSPRSKVWFTIAEGVITETFYPRLDKPAIRDLQFLVTDRHGFFSEQRRDTECEINELKPGIPAYRLVNRCREERYCLEQEIVTDPMHDALLLRVRFTPLRLEEALLYVLLAPHLGGHGGENDAWTGDFKSHPMLFAQTARGRESAALALACSQPFAKMSAGYVGVSDGWQDLHQHGRMEWEFDAAPDGNVALMAQIAAAREPFTFELALGFGATPEGAALNARSGLITGFENACRHYTAEWEAWQNSLDCSGYEALGKGGGNSKGNGNGHGDRLHRLSAGVLKIHEAKEFPGAMVASLSTPWGASRGDGETGYHMVWTRDLVESFGGLVAARVHEPARRVLTYLHATQEADGHWAQNMWVDGTPHWQGTQLDEVGLPILAAFLGSREQTLNPEQLAAFWPTIRQAALYLIKTGPVTRQGRWEEFSGYSPYTFAVIVSALLVAAEYAKQVGETAFADKARGVADEWNARIEERTYVSGTALAKRLDIDGYYAFIIPPEPVETPPAQRPLALTSRSGPMPAGEIVSPDALALVRFGLRAPDDSRILNTIKAIDALLKVETPAGPCWRRYNGDSYGEAADGTPFGQSGNSVGRAWPLLTGERAHYELAAGNRDEAIRLMHAMEAFAGDAGMLPEQIWDADDLPGKGLFFGTHTGSARPLVWAHSEYLKLRRSLHDGRVFDMPEETARRYARG